MDVITEHRPRSLPEEWLGLDWNVDTEDEIETAIRFFPMVLKENLHSTLAVLSPIQLLLAQEQTVSFVPIFAKLLTEAGNFLERQFVVKYGLRNILELLMTNCFPKIVFGYCYESRIYGFLYVRALNIMFGMIAKLGTHFPTWLLHFYHLHSW